MEDKKSNNKKGEQQQLVGYPEKERITSDVLGSYTGFTQDGEKPEQDADDL